MTITEAIAWLNTDDYESVGYNVALEMAIKALEQTRWIPTSERLPECHEEVLVTCANEVGIAWYRKFDHWLSNDFGDKWLEEHPPVAWQPLPQPFKAESEG